MKPHVLQSGSKLLSFDQQHAHFLTTSQKNDFSRISPPTMGNKSNAARRNRNKRQGSPFESQNEPTAVASSSKRIKRSKHTHRIDDNEQDVSTAHPRRETTPEDRIDHTRQYFKIMYCVMLGNTVVDEDTEKVRLVNLSIGNSMFKPSKTSTKLHPKLIVGSNGSLAMQ